MEIKPLKVMLTKERLITPSGLALVGALLEKTGLGRLLNRLGKPKEYKHQNNSCVFGYTGLLCQGKTAYEDMREMQEDPSFYCQALRINTIPSAEMTRQRLDYLGLELCAGDVIMEGSAKMLESVGAQPTPTFTGHVALDIDVSPHDNSKTKKEGVERTYKGVDGYAPIYAYIGEEGYVCNVELRQGSCHSQCEGTVEFLEDTLRLARQMAAEKLLVRMDSGNDALDNLRLFVKEKETVDYMIKRKFARGECGRLAGNGQRTWESGFRYASGEKRLCRERLAGQGVGASDPHCVQSDRADNAGKRTDSHHAGH